MQVTVDGNELAIAIEMQTPTISSTGKTMMVASDRKKLTINGKEVTVQVNAYYKAD